MKMRRERNIQPRERQDFRREDNNKRIAKIRNIELRAISIGPKAFLLFNVWCVFNVEKKKRLFPLKKRVFWFIFGCLPPLFLPFVLPTLSHFPISLSLSLSLSLFSCCLPSLFAFFFLSLFLCFGFLPCFFAFVSCKEEHQDITSERFLSSMFILFGCFPVFV